MGVPISSNREEKGKFHIVTGQILEGHTDITGRIQILRQIVLFCWATGTVHIRSNEVMWCNSYLNEIIIIIWLYVMTWGEHQVMLRYCSLLSWLQPDLRYSRSHILQRLKGGGKKGERGKEEGGKVWQSNRSECSNTRWPQSLARL